MKKCVLLFLLSFPSVGFAYQTTFNACTGCADFVGVSTASLAPGATNYIQNTSSLQSGATFYTSSGTVSGQCTVGTLQGASLSTCGDATHALNWTGGNFGCQTITAGGGGSSTLAISSGSATNSVIITSPTANVVFDSNTFIGSLQGTTTTFLKVNPSSATLLGPPPIASANVTLVSSGVPFGSVSNTIATDTTTLTFNNTNKEFTVDSTSPIIVASTGSTNMASAGFIVIHQGYAYLTAVNGNSLTVFDVANPLSPKFVTQIVGSSGNPPFATEGLEASGNYLYMLNFGNPNGGNTLTIWDISAPSSPTILSNLTDATNLAQCEHLRIYGNYLFIADYASDGVTKPGLTVVDVSNPKAPFVAGSLISSNMGHPIYIQIRYPYLYLTNEVVSGKLNVIDISTPTIPILKTSITPAGETASGTLIGNELRGRYLYVSDNGDGKLFTFDISSPTNPIQLSTVTFSDTDMGTIVSAGSNLFITESTNNKVYKLSVVNPSTPTITSFVQDANNLSRPDDIILYDHYVVTSNHGAGGACPACGGFSVIDIGGMVTGGITSGTGQFDKLSVTHDFRANRIIADTSLTANFIGSQALIVSSETVTGPNGLGVTYGIKAGSATLSSVLKGTTFEFTGPSVSSVDFQLNVGSFTGAGLATCGDTTHSLGWSATNNLFTCQNIPGNGGASVLAVTTGTSAGWTGPVVSSPTAVINFDSTTFASNLTGTATNYVAISSSGSINVATMTINGGTNSGTTNILTLGIGANRSFFTAGGQIGIDKSPQGSTQLDVSGLVNSDTGFQALTTNFQGGYFEQQTKIKPGFVMNSNGANFGFVENDNTGVWDLGFGNSATTLGTAVLKWDSSPAVTVVSSMTVSGAKGLTVSFGATASTLTVSAAAGATYEATFSTSAFYHVQISTNGHFLTGGSTPTVSSCGSTPNGSVVGNDHYGVITVGGGTVTACTLTFANTYGTGCIVACTISDSITTTTPDVTTTPTAMTLGFSSSIGGGTVMYTCAGVTVGCQ